MMYPSYRVVSGARHARGLDAPTALRLLQEQHDLRLIEEHSGEPVSREDLALARERKETGKDRRTLEEILYD